jgi:5-formyltetrahydrofolate cyclo-ligase
MANKNQRQIRRQQRLALRAMNKGNRTPRGFRKRTEALAKELGLTVPVYLIMRKEATHAEIKRTLLDGDRAGIVRDRDPVAA